MWKRNSLSLIVFLFSTLPLFGQASNEVNFTLLKVTKVGSAGITQFDLNGVDANGQNVRFYVADSAAFGIPAFSNCFSCSAPKKFATDVFPNPINVEIDQSLTIIKFYLTLQESPPVYMNTQFFSRKHDFYLGANTKLYGRIEIKDKFGNLVAFDNDVKLEGTCSILFWKPYPGNFGMLTDFKSANYALTDPRV
jgi:hypothetical protein